MPIDMILEQFGFRTDEVSFENREAKTNPKMSVCVNTDMGIINPFDVVLDRRKVIPLGSRRRQEGVT
ncbi:hypothetical protein CEXT_380921 [Caerostris extrusa]|uniref:Uncharacterized protein n=1 Tax=Caerostris extrusa TaxID=172846 RepID=A0AAV4W0M8_CAEEX|nr:hypothetical protein CEXT_380921 [Caerostris extrusa]